MIEDIDNSQIKIFESLYFAVKYKKEELRFSFEIYEIFGFTSGDKRPAYPLMDGTHVCNINDAPVFISGEVKWDGCSNWNFDANKGTMIHCCSRDSMVRIGLILGECYDIAEKEMEGFYG